MKLEVGMYVRHKPLMGRKYVKINKIKEIEEQKNCLHIWLEDKDLITEKHIIKASHNIIDLIEVGDYVNGYKVSSTEGNGIYDKLVSFCANYKRNITNEEIYLVLTHEQYEAMAYRVGSDK